MGQIGKVWLVGAGPGSADLLTVKASRLLEEADCIVYDRLVGIEILSGILPEKEVIDVGKHAGNHVIPQEEINQILVSEAKLGKKVVRLKGGDPFLFGRGGEEIGELIREGIPFEVVPGVTSALAVPAYNGIPVTHREYVSSVHIITGHHKAGCESGIPYDALVKVQGTLVFLMGVGALPEIMDGLMRAGMREDMPAAVLQQGTVSGQRKVLASVKTLADEAEKQKIKAPSVIVVGEACRLASDFSWREKLPLFGEKVIVTRPKARGDELQRRLRSLGAEVISIPVIETVPVREAGMSGKIREVIGRLGEYQILVFTSPYGVERFFAVLMEEGKDARALSHMKAAVIGQGTKDALAQKGILADYMPEKYEGISLGKLLSEQTDAGSDSKKVKILLARSSVGGREILREFEKNPLIDYTDLAIYDTVYVEEKKEVLRSCIKEGDFTRVIFTSSSTVEAFCRLAGELPRKGICAVCIGEKTEQAARAAGMDTVTARNATVDELITCICALQDTF